MSFQLHIDDRISLRLVEPRHAEEVFAVVNRNREHLDAWLPWVQGTQSADDTRAWATEACRKFGEQTDLPLTVLEDGNVVGGIGLHHLDSPHGSAEVGYWLSADRQGHGIMTRAARHVIAYGFRERGLHRVYLWADVENARSRAVAERLGMRLEGNYRESLKNHRGEHRDSVHYAVLASEWDQQQEQA